jgi:hypothetical protein
VGSAEFQRSSAHLELSTSCRFHDSVLLSQSTGRRPAHRSAHVMMVGVSERRRLSLGEGRRSEECASLSSRRETVFRSERVLSASLSGTFSSCTQVPGSQAQSEPVSSDGSSRGFVVVNWSLASVSRGLRNTSRGLTTANQRLPNARQRLTNDERSLAGASGNLMDASGTLAAASGSPKVRAGI